MDTQVKIRFYLFTSKMKKDGKIPIYTRITHNYRSIQFSTGLSVSVRDWNKKLMRFRGESNESKVLNDTLQSIELRVRIAVNQLLKNRKNVSVDRIKNEILSEPNNPKQVSECMETYISHIEALLNKDYTQSSLYRYKYTQSRILEFVRMKYKKSNYLIEDLKNNFLQDFEVYLRGSLGNSPKTVQKHIQRFSTMIRHCSNRGLISHFPFNDYKVKVPIKQIEYLTQSEIDIIEQKDIANSRLSIIRDLFVFSTYSGLSFRELKNLKQNNLKCIDGQYWVNMIRQKTKRQYNIPLLPKCIEIINRYQFHPKRIESGMLLPVPSNQKFNSYLKELQDICNIETKLTCHLARRTFGSTVLLRNNVNIQVISQLLGHSSTAITIKSYLGSDQNFMLSEFQKIKSIYSNSNDINITN
jgi:integrase/recombinase XerD